MKTLETALECSPARATAAASPRQSSRTPADRKDGLLSPTLSSRGGEGGIPLRASGAQCATLSLQGISAALGRGAFGHPWNTAAYSVFSAFVGIWILGFGILSSSAQVPNAPAQAVQIPQPYPRPNPGLVSPGATTGVGGASTPTGSDAMRSLPRALPPPRSNSIAVPSDVLSTAPTNRPIAAAAGTNVTEEMIQPGTMEFRKADLDNVLDFYALLANRTILRADNLPQLKFVLTTK